MDAGERVLVEKHEICDLPVSMVLGRSSCPMNRAALLVAACRAAIGESPASTRKARSSCRLKPGKQ